MLTLETVDVDLDSHNWAVLVHVCINEPERFKRHWYRVPLFKRAEIRDSVRHMWEREFELRHIYSHFLRVTKPV